jgi:tRNA threonylcarbamoyladenosine biosynthesis protein TsaB
MEDEVLRGEWLVSSGLTHSQRLMPALDFLLQETNLTIQEIDALVVSQGPGSFTGLRIGLSTARALAQGLQIPLVGVPTLELWAAAFAGGDGLILPLLDARRNEFYMALYRKSGQVLECLIPPRQQPLIGMADLLTEFEGMIWAVGDAVERDAAILKQALGDRVQIIPECYRVPRPSVLAQLGLERLRKGETLDYKQLHPLYLRQSEAEVKRLERLKLAEQILEQ